MDVAHAARAQIPVLDTRLTLADRLGALRVRLGFGRDRYRIDPGLYRIGTPEDGSPVLVTANYKLTVDTLRTAMTGRAAWLLVLDTRGINVWCAAGKGTFGTEELILRMIDSGLQSLTAGRTLVLPQLGAPGVAAHDVRTATGFRVVWGPVRACDLPAFLDNGMKADEEMRRIRFGLKDRLVVTGVEIAMVLNRRTLTGVALLLASAGFGLLPWAPVLLALATGAVGVLAGCVLTPALLPWIPGRMFAWKGALVGALAASALLGLWPNPVGPGAAAAVLLAAIAISSFTAMNFTGASTFTSPSGVLHEMRRALPAQAAIASLSMAALLMSAIW